MSRLFFPFVFALYLFASMRFVCATPAPQLMHRGQLGGTLQCNTERVTVAANTFIALAAARNLTQEINSHEPWLGPRMTAANAAFDDIVQTMSAIGSLLLQGQTNFLPLRQKLTSDWNVASSALKSISSVNPKINSYISTITKEASSFHTTTTLELVDCS